jgi:Flp pilus assembly pilin Flp
MAGSAGQPKAITSLAPPWDTSRSDGKEMTVRETIVRSSFRLQAAALRALSDRRGVTAVEYGVIAALIIVVCVVSISNLGQVVFTELYQKIAAATGSR